MSSSIKVIKKQNIIDLENIVVQFPSRDGSLFERKKFTAVNNVSLGIKAGETIGLVGESGCGKSTLANVIIGLLKPTSGLVKFNGLQMTCFLVSVYLVLRHKLSQLVYQVDKNNVWRLHVL